MAVNEILSQARQEHRTVLTEIEAKQILQEAGLPCTETKLATTKEQAVALSNEIGYRRCCFSQNGFTKGLSFPQGENTREIQEIVMDYGNTNKPMGRDKARRIDYQDARM